MKRFGIRTIGIALLASVTCLTSALTAFADTSGTSGKTKWTYSSDSQTVSVTGSGAMADYSYKKEPWANITSTGSTAKELVLVLRDEVGYLEKSSTDQLDDKTANAGDKNYTKYGRDMRSWVGSPYANGVAWCDCFADWAMVSTVGTSKAKSLLGGWSAYTPTSASYYKKMGQWYDSPKVGDQIFFENDVRIYHTGWVYKVTDTTVYTIEGNTGAPAGSPPNGGAVDYCVYSINASKIAGYGRPDYDDDVTVSVVKTVKVGSGVTKVGNYAFSGLGKLQNVTLPASLTTIGKGAFEDDSKLTRITIPAGVTSIGADAFSGCSSLDDVYFEGSASQWKKISIGSGNGPLTSASMHYSKADPTPTPKPTATPALSASSALKITSQPASVAVDADTLTKFRVETNLTSGNTYQWQVSEDGGKTWRDFTEKKTAKTQQLYFTITEAMHTWRLRCVVTNGSEKTVSNAVTITINGKATPTPTKKPTPTPTKKPTATPTPKPAVSATKLKFTSQPASVTVDADTLTKFRVEMNLSSGNTYQWQVSEDGGRTWRDFTEKKTAKTQQLYFTITASMNKWRLRCIVTDGSTTVTSKAVTITIS